MKAPSRAAVRSLGRVQERYRQCAALSPLAPARKVSHYAGERAHGGMVNGAPWGDGGLREEVRAMHRALPVATSWGRQLQPQRGFLGIGDGDEDIGLAKHFEEDRVIGYV